MSIDDIAGQVVAAKGFDPADGILRAAIRDQAGNIIKRLHRRGEVEKIGSGRGTDGGARLKYSVPKPFWNEMSSYAAQNQRD